MTRWTRLFIALLVVTCFIYIKLYPSQIIPGVTRSPPAWVISPKSVFIYKIFLDQRSGFNTLRVLTINRCHTENESMLSVRLNDSFISLTPKPIEGSCPWKWASGCYFATYIHELEVPSDFDQEAVMLRGEIQYAVRRVITVNDTSVDGLTVCVPPMYWYTDWTKLIFFIEWWKSQNATNFVFYYQSSTTEVKTVLEYYRKKGIIDIISWGLLPTFKGYDPNDGVYRLAHSLAHNDCLLRATTEFVTVVDVDEIIVPMSNSQTLMSIVQHYMQDLKVGALEFEHRVLLFYPSLAPYPFNFADVTFNGIHKAVYKNITGPPKIIVRRSSVHRISTHHVISFLGKNITLRVSDALLLHNRYNYAGVKSEHKELQTEIVENATDFQNKLQTIRDKIFPSGATFNQETQRALGACLATWRESQNNCKAPATACFKAMKNREMWIEDRSYIYGIA